MVLGPIIPGRPSPAKPVTPIARYIPAGAKGDALARQQKQNQAAIKQGLIPKPTRTTLGTGSIESKTARTADGTTYRKPATDSGTTSTTDEPKATKPLDVTLAQEEMDAAQAATDALRTFQENQAKMQLTQALGKIDRAAIEQYKGIAEDYAARGLARSGGKLQTEQKAMDEKSRAVAEATQAVTDFLNELKLTGNLEQARTNLSKSQAFQDYISGRLSPAMGG